MESIDHGFNVLVSTYCKCYGNLLLEVIVLQSMVNGYCVKVIRVGY